jgi:hypothetical protein
MSKLSRIAKTVALTINQPWFRKLSMLPASSQLLNANVYQGDAVLVKRASQVPTGLTKASRPVETPRPTIELDPRSLLENVSLEFAYDAKAKSLNITVKNKDSGALIRQISYKQMSANVYRINVHQGLFFDQLI